MALDPRLASAELLLLAAMRVRQRPRDPGRRVVVQVEYAGSETEPPTLGPTYVFFVPEKAP